MTEWRETKFSEVLMDDSISYGIVQPGAHTEKNSVPIIRVNNIKNGKIKTDDVLKVDTEIEKKYLRTRLSGGELLITVVGSVGECAIVPNELKGWNVARAVSVAKIKPNYDTRFIKYCFKADDVIFQMYGNTNDTVQPTLNLSSLKNLVLSLPSLPEQKFIASILSSLDDKIDLLHRQNKTLEAMAETLFRQWFVEGAREDWEKGTLGSIVEFNYGKSLNDKDRSGSGFPVVGSSGVVGLHEEYLVEAPGIVTGRKGTLGVINYMFEHFYPIDTTFYITSRIGSVGLYYEYFLIKNSGLSYMNSDSAVPGLNRNAAHAIPVIKPPMDLISNFNKFCVPLFQKLRSNTEQKASLEKLRDTLLPKLMSGEVRVS